jgi:hypothetical protein
MRSSGGLIKSYERRPAPTKTNPSKAIDHKEQAVSLTRPKRPRKLGKLRFHITLRHAFLQMNATPSGLIVALNR